VGHKTLNQKIPKTDQSSTSWQTVNHVGTLSLNFYWPHAFHDAQLIVSHHWRQIINLS